MSKKNRQKKDRGMMWETAKNAATQTTSSLTSTDKLVKGHVWMSRISMVVGVASIVYSFFQTNRVAWVAIGISMINLSWYFDTASTIIGIQEKVYNK